jgi:hypothetical protein
VGVIREKGPGVDGEGTRFRQRRETRDEIRAVGIIPEEGAALDPPHHHVVEDAGGVEAGLARHGGENSAHCTVCQRPPFQPKAPIGRPPASRR